jgi:DNA-binding CsgD family transcriptional regulator
MPKKNHTRKVMDVTALTKSEGEAYALYRQGLPARLIAERLGISYRATKQRLIIARHKVVMNGFEVRL